MRISSLLSWSAIVVGVMGVVAGRVFHVPKGLYLGVCVIGVGFAVAGLESLVTRRMSLRPSETSEHYAGVPAVIWGLMASLIGAAAIAAAYSLRAGSWHATTSQLLRHPGPAWAAIGLLTAGAGALLMVQSDRRSNIWRALFVRYPRTLIGLAVLLAGLLAAGIGVWEWFDPYGFNRYVHATHDVHLRAALAAWRSIMRGL